MRPVIAMPQMGSDMLRKYMKGKYVYSLKTSGADVRWIELDDPEKAVKEAMECDGLLLPGGADVSPALYGQTPESKCGEANTLRDEAEPMLYHAFIDAGKPVLGICRGIQLINVLEGGTLFQDIDDMRECTHMSIVTKDHFCHAVKIYENTKLSEIFNLPAVPVNSMHHQAIDKVGDGLTVSAVSEDGFTEGVEKKDYPFCVGVQWHPEHMYRRNPLQRKIFDAFVNECKKNLEQKTEINE